MSGLYPLLLIPIFDERPWGVRDLRPVYTRVVKEPIGESWLTWDDSVIANGPLSGRTLGEVVREYKRELVGEASSLEDRFPLLVKFLFTADKLSVQVHPNDDGARRVGQNTGKTECWYVLGAKPGAQVALGLKPGTTLEEFRSAVAKNHAENLLNWIEVEPGDMIYVPAGTVHTMSGGLVLVETQQTSDITYRLYDYGRPRELHIEDGFAAIKLQTGAGKAVASRSGGADLLVRSKFFQVEKMRLREPLEVSMKPTSPHVVVATDGAGILESPGMEPVSFARGEALVIPASVPQYSIRPQWDVEIMRMSLPVGVTDEPQTTQAVVASRRLL
jgi:mannose-6-phosphate isomerase